MKIVCDSCSTKYSISDDKVRGKVFKIRCKKCSHIIVVKGTTETAPAAEAPQAAPDAVWHLVVDGDQVGPLTEADLRGRLSRSEISAENYVWKEGFADWLRLADVPEFADLVPAPPAAGELFSDATVSATAAELGQRSPDVGAFFDAGNAAPESPRAASASLSGRNRAPAAAAPPEDDAFSIPAASPSSASSDGGDLFGAAMPVAARAESGRVRARGSNGASGRHDGGRVESLTAQRSENSVLFSLANLQSLAAPAPVAKAAAPASTTTEGSGLIDIRAMAASTLKAPVGGGAPIFGSDSRPAGDDLPAFGAFSSASPVLLGIPSTSGPPKWVYVLVALAAVMILAVGAAAFNILGKPVIVEQPAPPPAPVPVAPAPGASAKPIEEKPVAVATSKPLPEGELPPRENPPAGAAPTGDAQAAGDKGLVKPIKKSKIKRVATGEGKPAGAPVAAAAAAAPAEPEKPKPVKGSLDDLLEGALSKRPKAKVEDDTGAKKPAPEAAGGGGPLAKGAVVAGMNGVKGKISACYQQYKVPGLIMVNVVIGKSGKVSSAAVTGKFAGTPTGTCVENAVKTASFPPSDGLSTPYPFTLR